MKNDKQKKRSQLQKNMQIIKEPHKLTAIIKSYKKRGKTIGFVPTMGALHNGHVSLIKKARFIKLEILELYPTPQVTHPKQVEIGNQKQ